MIYFIQDDTSNLIKIGFVKGEDANVRLADLQTGSAAGLVLLGTMPGDRQVETDLHARFAAAREHGEWFRPVPGLIRFITEAVKTQPPTEEEKRRPGTIYTNEATVRTATVEIKTLTVRGKQVTLSVFKQLPKEDLLNPETAELLGTAWGKVNYFWGDCHNDHLHIVWQKGQELRRACVFPRLHHEVPGNMAYDLISERRSLLKLLRLRACLQLLSGNKVEVTRVEMERPWLPHFLLPGLSKEDSKTRERFDAVVYLIDGLTYYVTDQPGPGYSYREDPLFFLARTRKEARPEDHADYTNRLQKDAEALTAECRISPDEAVIASSVQSRANDIRRSISEATILHDSWKKRFQELSALDQLFIAV
jgi:hypothetical protein